MNHAYRLVWSTVRGTFIAVAENVSSRGKKSSAARRLSRLGLLASMVAAGAQAQQVPVPSVPSHALPTGGQVVSGQASVSQAGSRMDVNQASQRAILNWQQFNIGSGAMVNFNQPSSSSVALNRVVGADASQIMGRLTANGQVFLVNPNGVLFGRDAQVNVGAMVASALNVADTDFLAGNYRFTRDGASGVIQNEGSISASPGGYLALLSPSIHNVGNLVATGGTIALGAGEAVTLSLNGGAVSMQVDPAQVQAMISNRQLVQAEGGRILMTATAANALLGASINNSGTVKASSLVSQGGEIRLVANHVANTGSVLSDGTRGGSVTITARQHDAFGVITSEGSQTSGGRIDIDAGRTVMVRDARISADGQTDGGQVRLSAAQDAGGAAYLSGAISADGRTGAGGEVQITGRELNLFGTRVSATGATAGGLLRVGGGYQGADAAVPNALSLDVNAASFDVSASSNGTGGQAVFWSESKTLFAGNVDARGASGGVKATDKGGLVEVSSRDQLGFGGAVQAKTLLLDPKSLNIIEPGLGFEITNFVDPDAATAGFGAVVYDVSNTNLLVLSPNQNVTGTGAGYVFQRDGTLVSALRDTGGASNWRVLGNDRYLIANTGANGGLGAVSYFDAASSLVNGRMDATNSLVGDGAFGKGFGNLFDLGGGYYGATVRTDLTGLNSFILQRGAWHFFRANSTSTNLSTGILSASNSLVGSTAGTAPSTDPSPSSGQNTWIATTRGDSIGFFASDDLRNSTNTQDLEPYVSATLTSLGNGNWIMGSPQWNGNSGAVTFINPSMIDAGTLRGVMGSSNSVTGSAGLSMGLNLRADGRAGTGLLQFGGAGSTNFILNVPGYNGTGALVAIDSTVASTGIVGAFNTSNALLLGGSSAASITQLSSGDLVLSDSDWSSGLGYVRVVPFNTNFATTVRGSLAAVDATNSFIGSTTQSVNQGRVGSRSGTSIKDLGNGTFLIFSRNGTQNFGPELGAITYQSATSFLPGTLSATNSVLGTNTARIAMDTVHGLSNGAYLIQGRFGGNFTTAASGAIAYGAAGTRIAGTLGSTVGAWDGNYSGLQTPLAVTDLGQGYWLANIGGGLSTNGYAPSLLWGGPAVSRSGQLQSGDVMTEVAATYSLGNGSFVAALPSLNANTGAIGVVDATSAVIPTFTAANALVGANQGDAIGSGGFYALANGRFLALSPNWSSDTGAVTLLSPSNAASRLQGSLGSSNSLVGANAGDKVGASLYPDSLNLASIHEPVRRLGSTDMMALLTPEFDGGKGAATFFSRSSGDLTGVLGVSNSLVGGNVGDKVGLGAYITQNPFFAAFDVVSGTSTSPLIDLGNGKFALRTSGWLANAGDAAAAGALTFIDTSAAPRTGVVSASNSLVGAQAGDKVGYDADAPLLTSLGSGRYLIASTEFNGQRGAVTLLDAASTMPSGVLGTANSLVNNSATTGVFDSGRFNLVALSGGQALMTPEWDTGKGAVTWIPSAASSLVGAISSSTSLVGTTAGQKLGGTAALLASGPLLLGSPGWNDNRGAATLLANAGGLASTLRGTLTVDGSNSFVGNDVGDRLSSGGFSDLGNDIFVVQSPDVGSGAVTRTVFGAVTLGDSVTNALKGDINATNSFFSSVQGQAAAPYITGEGLTGAILSTGSEVGIVSVVQPVSLVGSGLTYADYGTRNVNMRPLTLQAVLNTGTDLTLQATDAINVLSPIVVNNPSGNGGHLTLQTNNASGAGVKIGSSGSITTDNGELTIISASNFINNSTGTSSPFNTGTNRWTVYANDPATSSLGTNLNFDFKEYGKTFGQTLDGRTALGSNSNAVVFAVAPTLSVPTPSDFKTYDATTALGTPYAISGLVSGDTVDVTAVYTDQHVALDPNGFPTQKDIVVTIGSGGVTSSAATGRKPVFGYINQNLITPGTTTFTGAGQISPFQYQWDLSQSVTVTKVYDGTDAAPAGLPLVFDRPSFQAAPPETFTLAPDYANGATVTFIDANFNPTARVADATQVQLNGFFDPNTFNFYMVTASGFSRGGLPSDYQFQFNNFNTAPAQITPKALTGGVTVSNKVYDGTTTATVSGSLTASLGGVVTSNYNSSGGALPDDVQISGSGTLGAANFSDKNAGTGKTVTINVSGLTLTGADASNYTVGSATATADITPKALAVTGSTVASKQYDGTATATINVGSLSGFVGSETVTATGAGTFASVNVGNNINVATTYTLANGANGGLASNYSLAGETLTGNITQAYLALIVGNLTGSTSKVYDGTTAAILTSGNFQLTGWVGSDGGDVTVTQTTGTYSDKNVGTNKLVAVTLASSDFSATTTNLSNYGLPTTVTGNIGEITQKNLTATYTGSNRVYNGAIAATVTGASSDVISGDVVTFGQSAAFSDKNAGTGKTVNVTGISLGGTDAGNYSLQNTTTTTTADITPKALTAGYSASNKVYDATTAATVTGSSSDVISGDTVTFSQSAAFTDKNAGTGKTVNVTGISLGGADAGNYSLQSTTATATADITQKALTAGYSASNKVYDATTAATVTGSSGDVISGDTVTFSQSAAFANKNAGTGKTVNVTGISLVGADAGNYSLQSTTATATADITQKALTAGYSASNKVYDATTAATVTGSSGDVISGDTVTFGQSAAFANKNAGAGKTVNVTGISLGGADAGNYSLQNTTANTTANITQASLSVTGASASNKTYDGTTAAVVTGGSVSALGSDAVTLSSANATFADKNAGTGKAVTTAYSLSGADANNYNLVQASGLTADITPKTVSASYTGVNKVYDATTAATVTGTLTGGITGDTVTFSQSAAFTDKNVGAGKTVNVTGISLGGADAGNYTLSSTSASTTADITPKALSIGGVSANNKVYDGTTTAVISGTASLSGVLGSDSVNVSGTAAGAFSDKNVGTGKSILVSGLSLSGTDAANYTVGALSATADITPKALTAGYSASNKVYDATTAATVTGSSSDVISGDTVTFSQSAAFTDKNAGTGKTVNVTGISLGGADAGNYSLQNTTATTTANITARSLAVTGATAANKVYDATIASTVTGGSVSALSGDVVILSAANASFTDKNVGTSKSVTTAYALSGTDAGNYTVQQVSGLSADITSAPLSVTGASAANKVYDGTTTASVSGGGVTALGSDNLNLVAGSASFSDKDAGAGKTVITAFTLSGTDAANYALVQPSVTASITPKQLTVTGLAAGDKTYDGTDAVTITQWGSVSTGVGAETLVLNRGSATFSDANAGNGKVVTATGYNLADGTNGGLASNYQLTSSSATTIANIAKAPLTMTALNASKAFSDSDPTLSAVYSGFVGAESSSVLTGITVTRAAGEAAGNYVITPAASSQNYLITPVNGTFTVAPADQLVIQLGNVNMVYGSTPTFSVASAKYYSSSGNVLRTLSVSSNNGVYTVDDGLGTTATFALTASGAGTSGAGLYNAGNHTITGAGLQVTGGNFSSSQFSNGNLSVSRLAVDLTDSAGTGRPDAGSSVVRREYDGTTTATLQFLANIDNLKAGDAVSLNTSNSTGGYADPNAGNGKLATFTGVTLSGSDANNYFFSGTLLAEGKVDQRSLTWTGVTIQNKVYDSTTSALVTGVGTLGNVVARDIGQIVIDPTSVGAAFALKDAGTQMTVNVFGNTTGTASPNYTLSGTTAFSDVSRAPLQVTGASAANKTYDGTTAAVVTGGSVSALGSDSVTLSSANATFADKNAGTGKAVTTAYSLSGADANNYNLVQASGLTADITPKTVSASYTGVNKVYDATTAATVTGTLTGGITGDTVTFSQSAAFTDKNVGAGKTVNVTGISLGGADAGNYTLSSTSASTTADITPKALSIGGVSANNKVYDGTTTAVISGTASLSGVLGSDSVNVSGTAAGAFSNKNVGTGKSILVSGLSLSGTDAANYTVGALSATADITPKALTAGYSASNKVYDATTAATVTGSSSDVISGDTVTFSQSAAFTDKNAGTGKTVNVTGISLGGADAGNYSLQSTTATATADITQKALTAGYSASNKVYDATTAATVTGSSGDVISGDTVTFSQSAAFANKNAGTGKTVNVTGISLVGADAGNYSLQSTTATATADITQKALTAGYSASNKVYDATTAATVTGSSGDVISGDTVTFGQSAAFANKNAGAGKTVNVTGISLGGADAGNYSLQNTTANTTANITQASLSVTGASASNKTYDGTTAAVVTGGSVSALGSDAVTLSSANATFADKNAGTGKAVTTAYSLSGADANNYNLVQASGLTADITPKTVSASYTGVNKVYDATTSATVTGTLTGGITGDTVTFSQSAAFTDKNVGAGKTVNVTGISLGGADAGNYSLQNTTANTTANITQASLSVTGASASNKTYDGTTAAVVTGGSVNALGSDAVTLSSANATFADKNAGTGKAVTTAYSLSGADANNYNLVQASGLTADITPKTVSASYTGVNKVYDATTSATVTGTLTGGITGDTVTFSQSAAFTDKNAGTGKTVNVTGISLGGVDAGNYSLQSTTATATADITQKALTAGYSASNKVYDATTAATVTGSSGDVFSGDTVTFSQSAAFANKSAGTGKTVNVTGISLVGADAGNYSLQSTTATATADITQKALTAGYSASNKVYDATTAATVTGSSGDVISGDTVTFGQSAAFANKNAGAGKTVNVTGISLGGADAGNYSLQNTTANTTANITQASLSVTGASASNKTYDGTTAAVVTGGSVSALGSDAVTLSSANATFADKNAGTGKAVTTAYSLSGADANNYNLVQASGLTADITPKTVSASYTGVNKVYDATTSATVTGTLTGGISGDTVTFSQSAAFSDKNAGTGKTVNVTGISLGGVDAGNYSLQSTTATTTADITPKTLTAAYTGSNKVYDATTAASVTGASSDVISGDTVTFSQSAAFSDKNAGTGKTVNVTGISLGGADAGNYSLQNATASTTADISPRPVAASYSAGAKVYDGTTTANVSGTVSGAIAGDSLALTQTAAFLDKNAGTSKPINVTGISLSGVDAINYVLQSNATTTAGNVDPRPVTAVYTASNRAYDGTTVVSVRGASPAVVSGDNVTFSQSASLADKNAGLSKLVNISGIALGGTDAGSYVLQNSTANALVDVSPKTLTVAYTVENKTFDGTTSATVTARSVDLVSGDLVSFSQTAAFRDAGVGAAKPVDVRDIRISGPDSGNYALQQSSLDAVAFADIVASGGSLSTDAIGSLLAQASAASSASTGTAISAPAAGGATPAQESGPNPSGAAPAVASSALPGGSVAGGAVLSQASAAAQGTVAGAGGGSTAASLGLGGTAAVATSSAAVRNQPGQETSGFIAVQPLANVTVSPEARLVIALPNDTFRHATETSGFRLEARLEDGSPLPSWVSFNSSTGQFDIRPPTGSQGELKIVILATDSRGNSATTTLSVAVQGGAR